MAQLGSIRHMTSAWSVLTSAKTPPSMPQCGASPSSCSVEPQLHTSPLWLIFLPFYSSSLSHALLLTIPSLRHSHNAPRSRRSLDNCSRASGHDTEPARIAGSTALIMLCPCAQSSASALPVSLGAHHRCLSTAQHSTAQHSTLPPSTAMKMKITNNPILTKAMGILINSRITLSKPTCHLLITFLLYS